MREWLVLGWSSSGAAGDCRRFECQDVGPPKVELGVQFVRVGRGGEPRFAPERATPFRDVKAATGDATCALSCCARALIESSVSCTFFRTRVYRALRVLHARV